MTQSVQYCLPLRAAAMGSLVPCVGHGALDGMTHFSGCSGRDVIGSASDSSLAVGSVRTHVRQPVVMCGSTRGDHA
eukprot:7206918-Alexandrium_andersonii.AAC.1